MSLYSILKYLEQFGEEKSIHVEIERNARSNICKETLQRNIAKKKTSGTSIVDYAKEYPSHNDFVLPIHEKQLLSQLEAAHSFCPLFSFQVN